MRRLLVAILLCCCLAAESATAATGRLIKVLPHWLDLQGRHALSPSLYERDAYQALLRVHPEKRSGLRFDVQWKIRGSPAVPIKIRIELRGPAKGDVISQTTLEKEVTPGGWFSHWSSLPLSGEAYRSFGDVTAWRATLWEGDRLLAEQKSFLW